MITEKQLREIIEKSMSIRMVLIELGLAPKGGNYGTIKRAIKKYSIDTSHFTGQGHLKGKSHSWTPKIPLSDILVENSTYTNNSSLRARLISEGVKTRKCECCNNTEWMGKPISIELEHINGIHSDNRKENLLILCPNCHAQTSTYRGKNKRKTRGTV